MNQEIIPVLADLEVLAMRLLLGVFFIFQFVLPLSAQDIEAVKNVLKAGHCPAAELSLISENERCDRDGAMTKACDQAYPLASTKWQECYNDVSECRKKVDDDNKVISESNSVYRQCMKNADKGAPTPPPPKASTAKPNGDDDLSKRLEAAKARGGSAAQDARKQDEEFEVQVRDINKRAEEQRRLQSREEVEREAAARDRERTERDTEEARKYVCFTNRRDPNYPDNPICDLICRTQWAGGGGNWIVCMSSCRSADRVGRHCALIEPGFRSDIIAKLHRDSRFGNGDYALPDKWFDGQL
jgi:hypothetical protein